MPAISVERADSTGSEYPAKSLSTLITFVPLPFYRLSHTPSAYGTPPEAVVLHGWGALTAERFSDFRKTLFGRLHSPETGLTVVLCDDEVVIADGYEGLQTLIENSASKLDAGNLPEWSEFSPVRRLDGEPRPVVFASQNWTPEFEALILTGVIQNGALRSMCLRLLDESAPTVGAGSLLADARESIGHEFVPGDLYTRLSENETFALPMASASLESLPESIVEPIRAIKKKTGHGAIDNPPDRIELEVQNPYYGSPTELLDGLEIESDEQLSAFEDMCQAVASVETIRAFPQVEQRSEGSMFAFEPGGDEFSPECSEYTVHGMRISRLPGELRPVNLELKLCPVQGAIT